MHSTKLNRMAAGSSASSSAPTTTSRCSPCTPSILPRTAHPFRGGTALPTAARPHQRANRLVSHAAPADSATGSSKATSEALKQQVKQLAGSKYGHDLSPEQRQQVESLLQQLAAQGSPQQPCVSGLTGTTWRPVYTNSTGTSSGKLGPFITEVTQVFPSSAPGTYHNRSTLGLVSAQLTGRFTVNGARVNLEFEQLGIAIGPLTIVKKVFEPGQMVGHWQTMYTDDSMRVFTSNKGNIFCLARS